MIHKAVAAFFAASNATATGLTTTATGLLTTATLILAAIATAATIETMTEEESPR